MRPHKLPLATVATIACLAVLSGCTPGVSPSPSETTKMTVPTLSPVIPAAEIPGRLAQVMQTNLKDAPVADCVTKAVLADRDKGTLTDTDLDNYLRNVVTDAMKNSLARIQDAGTCKKP